MQQQHIIKQHLVDIQASSSATAQDIFSETSRLFNNQIRDITLEVFDMVSDEDTLLRFDRVEIDLGLIPFPFSATELADSYRRQLLEELRRRIRLLNEAGTLRAGADEGSTEQILRLSLHDLFRQYLLSGTIAWWAAGRGIKNAQDVLQQFLEKDEQSLTTLIRELYVQRFVRKRIVFSFEDDAIKTVIRLLEPAASVFIFTYHQQVCLLQQEQQFVKTENTVFSKSLWLFILDFLAHTEGSRFNRKMFVRSTLMALAARFNMHFEKVLFYFSEAIQQLPDAFRRTENLPLLVDELSQEYFSDQYFFTNSATEPEAVPLNRNEIASAADFVFFYLVYGYFRLQDADRHVSELAKAYLYLLANTPDSVKDLLSENGDKGYFIKRIIEDLGEASVRATIQVAEPAGAEFILNYADMTFELQLKKNLVKTNEKDFRNSFWEIVLSFLLADRGSVFNARVFLESNIRSVARHYNMEYRALLAFLVQGAAEGISELADNSGLFYLLAEILKAEKLPDAAVQQQEVNPLKEISATAALGTEVMQTEVYALFLRNTWMFWLRNGTFPVWAKNRFAKVEDLLLALEQVSGKILAEVFAFVFSGRELFAGFFIEYRSVFLRLLKHFPQAKRALSLVDFFKSSHVLRDSGMTEETMELLIYLSLAEAYSLNAFASFAEQQFFSNLLVAIQRHTGVEEFAERRASIKVHFAKAGGPEAADRADEKLAVVPERYSRFKLSEQDVLRLLADETPQNFGIWTDLAEGRALELLVLYLTEGKLPGWVHIYNIMQEEEFVRKFLSVLIRHRPGIVKQIFVSDKLQAQLKMRLQSLVPLYELAQNAEVRKIVFSSLEKDLAGLLKPGADAGDGALARLKEMISNLGHSSETAAEQQLLISVLRIESVRSFLSVQIKPADFVPLMKGLGGERHEVLFKNISQVFSFAARDSFEREKLMTWLREYFMELLGTAQYAAYSEERIVKELISFLYIKKNADIRSLAAQLKKTVAENAPATFRQVFPLVDLLYGAMEQHLLPADRSVSVKKMLEAAEQKFTEKIRPLTGSEKEQVKETEPNPPNREEKEQMRFAEGDQVYINNAGLVLLHPFLSTLFSRCGYTQAGHFADEEKRTRAALLLHYVAMGTEGAKEEEMALNKLLCGMEMEEAFEATGYLNADEMKTAEDMLAAAMGQWDKMKNTSTENFRTSFLMRDGYLLRNDEAWVLRVEQRAYDILLQTLPWSFGMIKFSWMKLPLIIEWT